MKKKKPLASFSFSPDGFESHNVKQVKKLSTGVYKITFTKPLRASLWKRFAAWFKRFNNRPGGG